MSLAVQAYRHDGRIVPEGMDGVEDMLAAIQWAESILTAEVLPADYVLVFDGICEVDRLDRFELGLSLG